METICFLVAVEMTLWMGDGTDNFSCGGGTDTILDFSSFQDDVKSADCEIS